MEKIPEQDYIGRPNAQRSLKRCPMGQTLKWRLGWSTSGRLILFKGNYIIEGTHHGKGIEKSREEYRSNQEPIL